MSELIFIIITTILLATTPQSTRTSPSTEHIGSLSGYDLSHTESGWTSRYDPGLLENSAKYHGIDLKLYDGGAAAVGCDHIGEIWLVRPLGTKRWYRVVITDCAGDLGTVNWMNSRNIILELAYPLAQEWDALSGGIEIEFVRP